MEARSTYTWAPGKLTTWAPGKFTCIPGKLSYLGARYRSVAESVTLSAVYVIILVTGVVGNVPRSRLHYYDLSYSMLHHKSTTDRSELNLYSYAGVITGVEVYSHRCGRQPGDVRRHRLELSHAHGHQLLPVQPRHLRHRHSCARYGYRSSCHCNGELITVARFDP